MDHHVEVMVEARGIAAGTYVRADYLGITHANTSSHQLIIMSVMC